MGKNEDVWKEMDMNAETDTSEIWEIVPEPYIPEAWELPHDEKMKIIHAIWLCAWDEKCSVEEVNKRACKLLRIHPVRDLMEGFNADYADRAWCSRPIDWKPEDSLA